MVLFFFKPLPSFKIMRKPDVEPTIDSELDENDEPMNIVDHYSSLRVSNTEFLKWSDISLMVFPPSFLSLNALPLQKISHVDLSLNCLSSVPLELFLLPSLSFLNLSNNLLTSLPPINQWMKTKLETLILAHNHIIADSTIPTPPKLHQNLRVFDRLWYLDVSYNRMIVCPGWVLSLLYLKHLDLSGNQV